MTLARKIGQQVRNGTPFFGLEFFPPYTGQSDDIEAWRRGLDALNAGASPLYCSITWFGHNSPGDLSVVNSSSAMAALARNQHGVETMLHMASNGFTQRDSVAHLEQTVGQGVHNVLALHGGAAPAEQADKAHQALRLVQWARQLERERGTSLSVAVGGFPTGHPSGLSRDQVLDHLDRKVKAGADFVITSFVLDVADLEEFMGKCAQRGIKVPIVAGVLLFKNAASLRMMAGATKTELPARVTAVLEANEHNDAAVQQFVLELSFELCSELLKRRIAPGFHLLTMNQYELAGQLLRRLGLWQVVNLREKGLLKAEEQKGDNPNGQ